MTKNDLFRTIPKVDQIMERASIRALSCKYGDDYVLGCVRAELDEVRAKIAGLPGTSVSSSVNENSAITPAAAGSDNGESVRINTDPDAIEAAVCERVRRGVTPGLRPVINASGTILHTNLGRAPLSREAAERAALTGQGYASLEYDLAGGRRGRRAGRVSGAPCIAARQTADQRDCRKKRISKRTNGRNV